MSTVVDGPVHASATPVCGRRTSAGGCEAVFASSSGKRRDCGTCPIDALEIYGSSYPRPTLFKAARCGEVRIPDGRVARSRALFALEYTPRFFSQGLAKSPSLGCLSVYWWTGALMA